MTQDCHGLSTLRSAAVMARILVNGLVARQLMPWFLMYRQFTMRVSVSKPFRGKKSPR